MVVVVPPPPGAGVVVVVPPGAEVVVVTGSRAGEATNIAKGNLAKLQSMCGQNCAETEQLSASIAAGPPKRVQTAEVVLPEDGATQQN